MENIELYTISLKGLSLGSHVFDWKIDGVFFAMYEMTEISDASINAQVTLVKHSRFFEMDFVFNGWVEVDCDRCLDPLRLKMESKAKMFASFGEQAGEIDSDEYDHIVLQYGDDRLNVAQYLYEYVHLNLPLRRVHPDDSNGRHGCNEEMMSKLDEFLIKN